MSEKHDRIFSGEYSARMWNAINSAKTKENLRDALYLVCCRLQEFENRMSGEREEDSGWVRMSGSKPTIDTWYLVYVPPLSGVISYQCVASYYHKKGEWHEIWRSNVIVGVTHWRPLPGAPKHTA